MISRIAGNMVSAVIGITCLYVAGKIAFQAGREIGYEEHRYEMMVSGTGLSDNGLVKPKGKSGKLGALLGLGKALSSKDGTIWRLLRSPDEHAVEAYVEGDEIRVNVKRKEVTRQK